MKAGPMTWAVLRPLTMPQNVQLKDEKEDKDTTITH